MKPIRIGIMILSILACCLRCFNAQAQLTQRFDNVNYKAIYFKEACDLIAKNPNLLLLDVRSPGEYADTSRFIGSNIGTLKGAINISIDSVGKHLNDLKAYKDKDILIYCSHSQRSRNVSKRLSDSGFTHIYNLNGGMTEVNRAPDAAFPCKSTLVTSKMLFKLVGPEDALALIKDKNSVVLDVRSAAEFNGTDTSGFKNLGRIKKAINVPKTTLDNEIASLAKYKDRPVLVCDLYYNDAMTAARKLTSAGFKDVSVIFDGFDAFLFNFSSDSKVRKELIIGAPSYKLVGVRETVDLVNNHPDLVVADVRSKEQFENKAKQSFFNLGHIKNAVNFTTADEVENYIKTRPKSVPILIYGGSSVAARGRGMDRSAADLVALSKKLAAEGYTNVHLLYNGLYDIVWASGNVESQKDAAGILEDHKGLY